MPTGSTIDSAGRGTSRPARASSAWTLSAKKLKYLKKPSMPRLAASDVIAVGVRNARHLGIVAIVQQRATVCIDVASEVANVAAELWRLIGWPAVLRPAEHTHETQPQTPLIRQPQEQRQRGR